jgi:hypothetical protein
MIEALNIIKVNLGFGIENIILLVVLIGSIIFFAKDFRLGVVITFISMALLTMLNLVNGWDYVKPMVIMFIMVIILSFTLLWSMQQDVSGLN